MALTIKEAVRKWGPEYLTVCGLVKYFPTMNYNSHVFFVDGTDGVGDDGVNTGGQLPDEPFLTITKALEECTTNKNDYIFVLQYYQATGETWPISISKGRVHIIGISAPLGPKIWVVPTGNTAAFSLTTGSKGTEIAGFEMGAGANHACIEMATGGIWNVHFHHNAFGSQFGGTAAFGIRTGDGTTGGELINALIDNNLFGQQLTDSGIEVPVAYTGPNAVSGCVIRNNRFEVADGNVGINVPLTTANFGDGGIFDNRFACTYNQDGGAITFGAGTKGMVDGNHAMGRDVSTIMTVGTDKPFLSGADGMSWGANYASGALCIAASDYVT